MNKLLRSVLAVFSANAVLGVLGLLFVPFALGRLGAEQYGVYAVYGTLLSLVTLIDLGVGKNLTRRLAAAPGPAQAAAELRSVNTMYLVISGVLAVLIVPFAHVSATVIFPTQGSEQLIRLITLVAGLEFLLTVPVNLVTAYAVANERFGAISRLNLLTGLIRYGLMVGVVLWTASPLALALALALRRPLDLLLARALLGPLPAGSWGLDRNLRRAWRTFTEAMSLSLTQVLQLSAIAVGNILVNRFFGLAALGGYRAAFDIASRVWFFSNGVGAVIFPRLVKLAASPAGDARLTRALPALLRVSWHAYLLLGLLIALFGKPVVELLGVRSAEVQTMVVLLGLGLCLNAHANTSHEYLQSRARYRTTAWLAALSLGLIVGACLVLRPAGAQAIGYAWVLSQVLYALAADGQAAAPGLGAQVFKAGTAAAVAALVVLGTLTAGWPVWAAQLAAAALLAVWLWREWPQLRTVGA